MRELYSALAEALAAEEQVVLVTVVAADGALTECVGRKLIVRANHRHIGSLGIHALTTAAVAYALTEGPPRLVRHYLSGDYADLFIDPVSASPQLVILGAGHIGVALAAMASHLDYNITVIDDRPDFASASRFPPGTNVVCNPFAVALERLVITPATAIVIVTRGHQHDLVCLRHVAGSQAGYIGMIGSRRRIAAAFRQLAEEGIDPGQLARVRSPIGLDIGAETPAEIAVSILAELVLARRGGSGLPLSRR